MTILPREETEILTTYTTSQGWLDGVNNNSNVQNERSREYEQSAQIHNGQGVALLA